MDVLFKECNDVFDTYAACLAVEKMKIREKTVEPIGLRWETGPMSFSILEFDTLACLELEDTSWPAMAILLNNYDDKIVQEPVRIVTGKVQPETRVANHLYVFTQFELRLFGITPHKEDEIRQVDPVSHRIVSPQAVDNLSRLVRQGHAL